MGLNDLKVTFITERGPLDSDPHSYWLWQEMLDLAQSGKEVQVFLLRQKEVPVQYHHGRLHIVPTSYVRPQTLMQWKPQTIHLIEPSSHSSLRDRTLWYMSAFLAHALKQSRIIYSELAGSVFSASPQIPAPILDRIYYTHPKFHMPLARSIPKSFVEIQPWNEDPVYHWSMEDLENKIVVPSSWEASGSNAFLDKAKLVLAQKPWTKFLFLRGLGQGKNHSMALQSDLSRHFLFPETLNGEKMLYALLKCRQVWLDGVDQNSALGGLALQLSNHKAPLAISSRSAYGVL